MQRSNVIIFGLVLIAGLAYGMEYFGQMEGMYWIYLPALVLTAACFAVKRDLDYYLSKHAQETLGKWEKAFLEQLWYLYGKIPDEQREVFLQRVHLKIMGNDYRDVGNSRPIPKEIVLISAATAAYVEMVCSKSFGDSVYVYYQHPFHSPEHRYLHIEESYEADNTFIFSMPHFRKGALEYNKYLDICLYTHLSVMLPSEQNLEFNQTFASYLMKKPQDIHTQALKKCVELAI